MSTLCRICRKRDVEVIDDWESDNCRDCNDRLIERNNARAEWDACHDEPCPEIELPPKPTKAPGTAEK
jgi:RNase P subunit RPR2